MLWPLNFPSVLPSIVRGCSSASLQDTSMPRLHFAATLPHLPVPAGKTPLARVYPRLPGHWLIPLIHRSMELNSPYRPCRDTPSLPLCNVPKEQRNRKWDGCDQSLPGSSTVKSASVVSVQVITSRLPRKRLSHPALSRVAMRMTGELKSTLFFFFNQ